MRRMEYGRRCWGLSIELRTSKSKSPRLQNLPDVGHPLLLISPACTYCTQVLLKLVSTLAAAAMLQYWFVPAESVLLKTWLADWSVLPIRLKLESNSSVS